MLSISTILPLSFLKDVAEYAAFLDSWFSAERWASTEPGRPLQSGIVTSAEIAYVLLRFGRFYTADWEAWREEGFVALDTALNGVLFQIKGLLRAGQSVPSAELETMDSAEEDRLKGLTEILNGERSADDSPYMQYPLLYALAVHVFLNLESPGTDVVPLCHRLNLIVSGAKGAVRREPSSVSKSKQRGYFNTGEIEDGNV